MANRYDPMLSGGGELALEAMDDYQREEIGRKTFDFCRSVLRSNPELRAVIREMAEKIREEEATLAAG